MIFAYRNSSSSSARKARISCIELHTTPVAICTFFIGLQYKMLTCTVANLTHGLGRHDSERINPFAVAKGALNLFKFRRYFFHIHSGPRRPFFARAMAHLFQMTLEPGSLMPEAGFSSLQLPASCFFTFQ